MRSLIKGVILLFVGPLLGLGPALFPGGVDFTTNTPFVGLSLFLASLAVMIGSSYFFGKEWGIDERIILAAGAPAVTFFLFVLAAYTLTGGYHGTGGGADFIFLWVPAFIFILGVIFATIGGSKKREAEKPETEHTDNKTSDP